MAFHFSRDTKVFMKFKGTVSGSTDALYELPVLDGYSFSQATNSSEITLSEAADSAGNSKRGRAMFNDSFAPAEWSFSTYMRPTTSAGGDTFVSNQHAGNGKKFAIEGPLWAAMSAESYGLAVAATDVQAVATWEPNVFNFQNSNKVALGVFDLYFVLGAAKDTATGLYVTGTEGVTVYKISDCSIGTASIDFDIEGLAQVAWSGQGKKIKEVTQLKTTVGATSPAVAGEESTAKGLINEGITSTSNYIRQKLTSLAIEYDVSSATGTGTTVDGEAQMTADTTYNVVLTGGNISIENNLTYLTPETLGSVNQPLGHVMGTRSVSGNFTCYLNTAAGGSMDLLEDLHEASDIITNSFNMTFSIGGSSNPKVSVALPNCHLELPTHSIEDVISVDVNFHALPADLSSATASSSANEMSVTYSS